MDKNPFGSGTSSWEEVGVLAILDDETFVYWFGRGREGCSSSGEGPQRTNTAFLGPKAFIHVSSRILWLAVRGEREMVSRQFEDYAPD